MTHKCDKVILETLIGRLQNLVTDYEMLMVDLWKGTSPEWLNFEETNSLILILLDKKKLAELSIQFLETTLESK
jgi:hypothetical protein